MEAKRYYQGTGRRKTAVARVRLFPGSGDFIVNGKKPEDYFGNRDLFQRNLRLPLVLTNHLNTFNVLVKVKGVACLGRSARCGTVLPAPCSITIASCAQR